VTFSQRHEIGRPADGLISDSVPEALRNEVKWILERYFSGSFDVIYDDVHRLIGRYRKVSDFLVSPDIRDNEARRHISEALDKAEWFAFFDALEAVCQRLSRTKDKFANDINEAMRRHYMAYELRNCQFERVGTKLQDVVVAEARGVLRDPDLAGPNEHFLKAIGFFSRRPEPDKENCVKEAVAAVEGMARVLLSDHSIPLSDGIKKIGKEKGVHRTLQKIFEDLYAFRGDADGVAHGASGAGHQTTPAEAELALNVAGGLIVYLARLYGRGVE